MLMDFIWKAFEQTGDTRYYIEYIKYRDIFDKSRREQNNDRMDRTG
jgi:hypothetical protein